MQQQNDSFNTMSHCHVRNTEPTTLAARGPCNLSTPSGCHTRNILDRLTCFLTSAMYTITALLVVSLCFASGQRTDVPLDSCTYSFVVQSPHCWREGNSGWESEVASLRETVDSLNVRLKGSFRQAKNISFTGIDINLCRCCKV